MIRSMYPILSRGAALSMFLGLAACGSSKPSGLYSNAQTRLTFYDGGTAVMDIEGRPLSMTWQQLDDGKFLITNAGGFESISLYGCTAKDFIKLHIPAARMRDKTADGVEVLYSSEDLSRSRTWNPLFGVKQDCDP